MRARGRSLLGLVALGLALALVGVAQGQTLFEKLVMPGELVQGHADLESKCESCHLPFEKGSQPELCLKCHRDVAADIDGGSGFHGLSTEVGGKPCKACHTDHIGREAKIVVLDTKNFDHELTDFLLKGKHKAVACEKCHKPAIKFRKASSVCNDCHQKDDVHKGGLGPKCESCHNEAGWKTNIRFDHSKTKFPLEGGHRKVACAACHANQKYKGVPTACIGCHQKNDVHKGRLGKDCGQCHSVARWQEAKFDHDRQTKFPLRGAHSKVACSGCHGKGAAKKVESACIACHKTDDAHKGQLGPRCETCHNETSWRSKATFDHNKTRFPLRGLHVGVGCRACHKSASFKNTPLVCAACHEDRVHQGRLGTRCEQCHGTKGWPFFKFDHDRQTSFRLTGAHRQTPCHACHKQKNPDSLKLPVACIACHAADDVHRGSYGRRCERCHSTKTFRDVRISQ
ncbi:MAG: cytochrome C [Hyphomicrobiaceae bacterium]